MLFDTHAHINSKRYKNDIDRIIKNLKADGVELVVVPGTFTDSSKEAVDLAKAHKMLYATVGVHPSNTDYMDNNSIEILRLLARNKKVVAIGEIGLDYHHMHAPKEVQIRRFIEQIELAKEVKKPIVIHDRKANEETFKILKSENAFKQGVLMHCYSGDLELAKRYIKNGAMLSIAGPVTYKSAHKLKAVAKHIPLEHLVIETDAPYLQPAQIGKRRNEPKYVKHVAEAIAELKGISYEKVCHVTMENGKKFFKITHR
jgi:TatD DNase family protein